MNDTPPAPVQKNTGFNRLIKACGYTRDGLIATFKSEAAFRQETALAAIAVPLACFLAHDRVRLALMIASVLMVLVVELLNSAIECVVDRFGHERHALSKQAKDAGSAAVFIALVIAGITWALCLL